jgi:hypothetical protein
MGALLLRAFHQGYVFSKIIPSVGNRQHAIVPRKEYVSEKKTGGLHRRLREAGLEYLRAPGSTRCIRKVDSSISTFHRFRQRHGI